jgi:p-cumate 2,3-dioxygenase subunit alpha
MNAHAPIADGMIIDDVERGLFRVNRRVFTQPQILEEEKHLIFEHSWLYVGHESELPRAGSFIRRKVASRWVIFLRDEDSRVRIFFDTCTHRGNSLTSGNRGEVKGFTCFYHGWSFNTKGELTAVPDRKGYAGAFDFKERSLGAPPRMDSYRGLVFLSFDRNIIGLEEYLGNAREYLDLMLDFSDSEIEISTGQQAYSMKANWKLLVENSIDVYHGMVTHARYFGQFLKDMGADPSAWKQQMQEVPDSIGLALDHGHAVVETPNGPLPVSEKGAKHLVKVRANLEKKFGAERTHRILDFSRNLSIFPNLVFVANFRTIRTFYPVSPDYLEVTAWCLMPKDDPPELKQLRLDNFLSFLGPGGFATPDDVEALENCQRGFSAASEVAWSDISRGMLRIPQIAADEVQMRAFWRRWYQQMNPQYVPGVEPAVARRLAAA